MSFFCIGEKENFESLSGWDLVPVEAPRIGIPTGAVSERLYLLIMVCGQQHRFPITTVPNKWTLQFRSILMHLAHTSSIGCNQTLFGAQLIMSPLSFLWITHPPWRRIVPRARRRAMDLIATRYCSLISLPTSRYPLTLPLMLVRRPKGPLLIFHGLWPKLAWRSQWQGIISLPRTPLQRIVLQVAPATQPAPFPKVCICSFAEH